MMYEIKPAVIMRTVIKLIKASVNKHMYTSTHLHSLTNVGGNNRNCIS